ncbi:MAG: permease [Candidatus Omnitrophota bacterium]
MMDSVDQAVCCHRTLKKRFYKNKALIVAFVLLSLIVLSFQISFLVPFRVHFFMYLNKIWWAVLLGLFLGGAIDYFIPREYISKILAGPEKGVIVRSVLLGFLMSACSHGILALSMELHKKGASNPAVVAFLLASPWANIAITVMLIGFFGVKAFYIILSALFIALATGFIFQMLERKGLIEKNKNIVSIADNFSIRRDIRMRLKAADFSLHAVRKGVAGIFSGTLVLGDMVVWWILVGIGLASLFGAYVPVQIFHQYMGPTILGLFVTLAAATIIEVCSEGSSPLAFEIFRQTGAFGNSFVFLMAGVVTDYTEIGLLWHNVGRKTAVWLPIIAVPQVIVFGLIGNIIF